MEGRTKDDGAGVTLNDAFYFNSMQFMGKTPQNFSISEGFEFVTVFETLLGWLLMALFLVAKPGDAEVGTPDVQVKMIK